MTPCLMKNSDGKYYDTHFERVHPKKGEYKGWAFGGDTIVMPRDPKVTMDGVEFLQENARMRKALEFLKETKSSLPFI